MSGTKQEYPALLALGWHQMDLAGLRTLCVDRFPMSLTRQSIMNGLEAVIAQLNASGMPMALWINGSFLTEKLNPEDVDFVAKVDGADFDAAAPHQQQILKWIATDLKTLHKCDTYSFVQYQSPHPLATQGEWQKAYWLRQFGFDRSQSPKGLAVIEVPFLVV